MSITNKMIDMMRDAALAHSRIVAWHPTDEQAMEIAEFASQFDENGRMGYEIYMRMKDKSYLSHIFGARIEIRA